MNTKTFSLLLLAGGCVAVATGCNLGPRMTIVTGTTVGLHVSPGDMRTTPPTVTFAYKRSETALVPTAGSSAKAAPATPVDTYSALTVFHADIYWFKTSQVQQVIATGHAARSLVTNAAFGEAVTTP